MSALSELGLTSSFCLACVLAAGKHIPALGPGGTLPPLIGPAGLTEDLFAAELQGAGLLEPANTSDMAAGAQSGTLIVLNGRPWVLKCPEILGGDALIELLLKVQLGREEEQGRQELVALWKVLCQGEVLAYLAADLVDHQFDREWSSQAVDVLSCGLSRFSASKMFYLCHVAVRDMASFYLRRQSHTQSLPQALMNFLSKRVDSAYTESWKASFGRHRRQEQSTSAVLFSEFATTLGPNYLGVSPCEDGLFNVETGPAVRRSGGRRKRQ